LGVKPPSQSRIKELMSKDAIDHLHDHINAIGSKPRSNTDLSEVAVSKNGVNPVEAHQIRSSVKKNWQIHGSEARANDPRRQALAQPSRPAANTFANFKLGHNPKRYPWLPGYLGATSGEAADDEGHKWGWRVLSPKEPRALYLSGVLSLEDCQAVIDESAKWMARSNVIKRDHTGSEVNDVRTSTGTFLVRPEHHHFQPNLRMRKRARLSVGLMEDGWIEATQILHYEAGQFYRSHKDYFDPDDALNMNRGGQRIATMIVFLKDCLKGGESTFPLAGLKVPPKRGDAVIFYSAKEDGTMDEFSEHGGDPPQKGHEKWIAVMWMHPRVFT